MRKLLKLNELRGRIKIKYIDEENFSRSNKSEFSFKIQIKNDLQKY